MLYIFVKREKVVEEGNEEVLSINIISIEANISHLAN